MKSVAIPIKPDKKEGIIKEAEWRTEWKSYNDQYSAIQQDHKIRILLKWFKEDFFQWLTSPQCSVCKVPPIHVCTDLRPIRKWRESVARRKRKRDILLGMLKSGNV